MTARDEGIVLRIGSDDEPDQHQTLNRQQRTQDERIARERILGRFARDRPRAKDPSNEASAAHRSKAGQRQFVLGYPRVRIQSHARANRRKMARLIDEI